MVFIKNDLYAWVRSIIKKLIPASARSAISSKPRTESEKKHQKLLEDDRLNKLFKIFLALDLEEGEGQKSKKITKDFCEKHKVNFEEGLDLCFLLIARRFYYESILIREYSIHKYVEDFELSNFDNGNERIIGALIEKKYFGGLSESESDFVRSVLIKDETGLNNKLRSKISGKKILIVGPSFESLNCLQKDADESDVCLFPNLLVGYDELDLGDKFTVSYYNEYNAKRLFYIPSLRACMRAQYHVFRSVLYYYQYKLLKKGKAQILSGRSIFFNGKMTAIQTILTDILRYNPSSIKIAGTTFFCSDSLYTSAKYMSVRSNVYYDLARHDPISNFIFVKFLYDLNLVSLDDITKKIVDMSLIDYLENISNNLG
ncbi:hypothetical protein [Neptuniibacter sp. QD48_11]|uniref:hypothetical protein n=1 Tax=unclassified Neptuniibacter TaxID=2630693 RepID=UPI0039F4FF0E